MTVAAVDAELDIVVLVAEGHRLRQWHPHFCAEGITGDRATDHKGRSRPYDAENQETKAGQKISSGMKNLSHQRAPCAGQSETVRAFSCLIGVLAFKMHTIIEIHYRSIINPFIDL